MHTHIAFSRMYYTAVLATLANCDCTLPVWCEIRRILRISP